MHRKSSRAGLLVETVVSIGALIPLLIILVGVFPFGYSAERAADHRMAAYELARNAIETARASNFSAVTTLPATTRTRDGYRYRIEQKATQVSPGLKRLTVTVNWASQSLCLQTQLARTAP